MFVVKMAGFLLSYANPLNDSAMEQVKSEQIRIADSAWSARKSYLEASASSGVGFGGLLDEEQEFADDIGYSVATTRSLSDAKPAVIMISAIGVGIGIWNQFSSKADLGLGYRFHLEQAETQLPGKSETVLNAHEVALRGRYWLFRRLNFQIGPQIGWGWNWGQLNRYGLEQNAQFMDPTLGASERSEVTTYLRKANQDLSFNGSVVEFGGVMNVRIVPAFVLGGGILAARRKLNLSSSDPLKEYQRSYPSSLTNWEASTQLHVALLF
ncbi:MAG: hypothetical protein IPN71_09230 [Fibrobacteres bacterium]|nr:hypothetical protein [Fibrobacterota bacterium]